MTQAMSTHPGKALGTDFFSIREQFTDEQWSHFITVRKFADEVGRLGRRQGPRLLAVAGGALCLAGVAVSRSRSRVDQKASAQPAEATPILGTDGAIDTLERSLSTDLASRRTNP